MSSIDTSSVPRFQRKEPVKDVIDELENNATTKTKESDKKSKKKTERISVIVSPEIMEDLNDLLSARTVAGKKVEGAIMGKKSKKPSVNLLIIEALNTFLNSPEIKKELADFRGRFGNETV